MEKYSSYSVEQFAGDPEFISWVKNPDNLSDRFWKEFLTSYPEMKSSIDQARDIILSLDFNDKLTEPEKEEMWGNIESAIINENESAGKVIEMKGVKKLKHYRRWYWVAAVTIGILVAGGGIFYFQNTSSKIKEATLFGEIRKVTLPDGSAVTLNAHSEIKYKHGWSNTAKREVWLEGEAYFSVTHKSNNQPFIVHSPEMDIEVLGTEFNVFKRDGKFKVSLNSGKVKLSQPESKEPPVYMKPGELIEFLPEQKLLVKKTVNPANYSAWKDNRLVLDDTPFSDIIQMMKNIYGWEVTVEDDSILSEKLTGEIETKNELKFLNALSKTLDINLEKNGNRITIARN
jgi:transmembrane sensor